MSNLIAAFADKTVGTGPIPSAQAWFAGGERVGYDPKARAIVAVQDAPLKIFLRRQGDVAHAISFLPGYPDGSFGWAKVLPHLPNANEMPKLFVEYVGMGDSDKPKDYAYSTAERTDLGTLGAGGTPGRAGHTRRFHFQWWALHGWAHPPLVHHADFAPPPKSRAPAPGAVLHAVQNDGGGDVVKRISSDGCRGPRVV